LISTQASTLEIDPPAILLSKVPTEIRISGALPDEQVRLSVAGTSRNANADAEGIALFPEIVAEQRGSITLSASSANSGSASVNLRVLPGWVSIMPPLVAILIALTLRNVIPALLIGVWLGATALRSFSMGGIFLGLLDGFEIYVVRALAPDDRRHGRHHHAERRYGQHRPHDCQSRQVGNQRTGSRLGHGDDDFL
jgi:hypothetical protein